MFGWINSQALLKASSFSATEMTEAAIPLHYLEL
jgi:hypothetical protein